MDVIIELRSQSLTNLCIKFHLFDTWYSEHLTFFSPRDNNEQKHELLKYHKFITVKSNFQLTTIDSKYKTTAEVSICGMAFGLYRFLTKSNTCCGRQLTMQFLRYTTFGEGGWSKQWFVRAVSLTVMTLFTPFGTALFLGLFWKLMS